MDSLFARLLILLRSPVDELRRGIMSSMKRLILQPLDLTLKAPLQATVFSIGALVVPLSRADSITTESDWNQNNAIQLARQQIPTNATMPGRNAPELKSSLATLVIAAE